MRRILFLLLALWIAGCSRDPAEKFDSQLARRISPERMQAQLAELTAVPHRAGTAGNRKAADSILSRLRQAGLRASIDEHQVLLHEPVEASLELVLPLHKPLRIQEKELPADPFTSVASRDIPYLAYVPDFDLTAEVIYANYGSREDYAWLKQSGVSLAGKIALVRAQGLCRGMKGIVAEQEGLAGLLLYPELKDMGFAYPAYPDGRHINPWTVQRGSMLRYFQYPGEPKTAAGQPGSTLPSIPALAISEESASEILNQMQGPAAPAEWKGWLKTPYRTGAPGPTVHMKFRGNLQNGTIRNLFATIPGTHPDEPRVIVGCHYDAWVYGAADPSSATTVVLELADVMSQMLKEGWKPRRGIQFAFWDAEEFGMLGSTRWVEANLPDLRDRVSVYLSVDTAVRARDFVGNVQPGLCASLDEALMRVPDPATGTKLHDVRGEFALPGFSGDVAPFTSLAGVPTAELAFGRFYPLYHSLYDDYRWFTEFADPGFQYSASLTRILGLYARSWMDDALLPYRFSEIAEFARDSLTAILSVRPEWRKSASYQDLDRALQDFEAQSDFFDRDRSAKRTDPELTKVNTQLHAAMKSFTDPAIDFSVRNALLGPSEETGCNPDALPGLQRSLHKGNLDQAAAHLAEAFRRSAAHLKNATAH